MKESTKKKILEFSVFTLGALFFAILLGFTEIRNWVSKHHLIIICVLLGFFLGEVSKGIARRKS